MRAQLQGEKVPLEAPKVRVPTHSSIPMPHLLLPGEAKVHRGAPCGQQASRRPAQEARDLQDGERGAQVRRPAELLGLD